MKISIYAPFHAVLRVSTLDVPLLAVGALAGGRAAFEEVCAGGGGLF